MKKKLLQWMKTTPVRVQTIIILFNSNDYLLMPSTIINQSLSKVHASL